MPTVTTLVSIISANLRKDMHAKTWEAGLKIVLRRMGPRTVLGLQEAYTRRNTKILRRVAKSFGLSIIGAGTDSCVVYDPKHLKLLHHEMHPVAHSSRLFISPTRYSLTAQFQVVGSNELFGVLVNHRMNGVYTADAPLKFYKFRLSAWNRHRIMDEQLTRDWTHLTFEGHFHHCPMFLLGDENAHHNDHRKYSFDSNPFGDNVSELLYHHVSDYIAVSKQSLTPNHRIEVLSKDSFHDHSDHLALVVHTHIHHTVKEAA